MSLVRVPVLMLVAFAAVVTLSAQQTPPPTSLPAPPAPPRPPGGVASGPPLVPSFESAMLSAPPEALGLDPFYKKYADAFGIPIVSSEKVADAALLMARDIVNYMLLKRPDVRDVMIGRKSRVLIMSINEGEMDLPERRDWKKPAIDDRAAHAGRAPAIQRAGRHREHDGSAVLESARARGWAATSRQRRREHPRHSGHALLRRAHPRARVQPQHHGRAAHWPTRRSSRKSRPRTPRRRRRASISGQGSTRSTPSPSTGRRARSGGSGRTSSSTTARRRRACRRPTSSRHTIRRCTRFSSASIPATTFRRTSTTGRI